MSLDCQTEQMLNCSGSFSSVSEAPTAAVNIFGLPNPYQQDFILTLDISQDICLFVPVLAMKVCWFEILFSAESLPQHVTSTFILLKCSYKQS